MTVNQINPDSVILKQLDGHWQKIATMLMHKLSPDKPVRIDSKYLEDVAVKGIGIMAVIGDHDGFTIKLVGPEEAVRIVEHDKNRRGTS